MENIFIGEYTHSLDPKGRLSIPKKFRSNLAGGGVVTRGLDGSLFIWPQSEWRVEAEKLAAPPKEKGAARTYARLMLAGANEFDIDNQGRIMIPAFLREYAGIKNSVVIAGLYNRLELWSEARWKAFKAKAEKEINSISEELGGNIT